MIRTLLYAIPLPWLLFGALALVTAASSGIWWWGHQKYLSGVREATGQFLEADRKGADDARETAERVLRDLADVDDPDELLTRTRGLRD